MTRLFARYALAVLTFCAFSATARAFTLLVHANPDGALVTIEGKTLPAPATFELKRRDEPYAVVVEKPGYQTENVSYFTKQKLKEISVTLEPLQHRLTQRGNVEPAAAARTAGRRPEFGAALA